jgi:hypothetical protein
VERGLKMLVTPLEVAAKVRPTGMLAMVERKPALASSQRNLLPMRQWDFMIRSITERR